MWEKVLDFGDYIFGFDGILISVSNFISGMFILGGRCLKFLLYRFGIGL